MRILRLTSRLEEKILAARQRHNARAEAVSSRIVGDVRRRGDAALFGWTRRLDDVRLTPRKLWVGASERREGSRAVSKELRAALEHAARNIRRVARIFTNRRVARFGRLHILFQAGSLTAG